MTAERSGDSGGVPGARPRRVLILSADIGEGHATAARALAVELRGLGAEVSVCDDLRSLGRLQRRLLCDGSRAMFRWAPWLYGLAYWALLRLAPARRFAARSLERSGRRPLLRILRAYDPDVVISTYPGTTVVLGALRRRGRLLVPAVATITDLTGLFFWAARGIDLHLVAWSDSAQEVLRLAPDSDVRSARPPTAPAFFAARTRAQARTALGLDPDRRIVIVSGGGWGIGDLTGAVHAALGVPDVDVLCLPGRNERARTALEASFRDEPRVRVLGFTDRMSDLLAAADALVHATGGVTCLEARLRGCPTIAYGFPVGHVRHNTRAMARLGLLRQAPTADALPAELAATLAAPRPAPVPADAIPAAGPLVLAARAAVHVMPSPWPRRALAATATVALAGALLSTGAGYSLAARGLDLEPLAHVATRHAEVGLVVQAPPAATGRLIAELRHAGAGASIAVPPGVNATRTRRAPGIDLLPALPSGQLVRWLDTPDLLKRARQTLGLRGPASYLAPSRRFTLGQYLLGRRAGGTALTPRLRLTTAADLRGQTPQRGDVVAVEASSHGAPGPGAMIAIVRALRARGMRPVSLVTLQRDAGHR